MNKTLTYVLLASLLSVGLIFVASRAKNKKHTIVLPTKSSKKEKQKNTYTVSTKKQVVASSYASAIDKSKKLGMPIFVFFEARWCKWCKKMKYETLTNDKVKQYLSNYILVYVDIDENKQIARKYKLDSVPTYVITNGKEEVLKRGSGYLGVDSMSEWLDNPKLYKQPVIEDRPNQPSQPTPPQPRPPINPG